MNKNIMIVLGGAILAAVLVAILVQVSMGGKSTVSEAEGSVQILVASKDLKVGKELGGSDLRWQDWPEGALFKGAIIREADEEASSVLEGRLRRSIAKDEAITKSIILKETKGNIVANALEQGQRAMAIKVEAQSMVAGFIKPGDYVDVILTYKESIKIKEKDPRFQAMVDQNINKMASETILERVRVIGVDQTAERDEDEEDFEVGKTVTLAVDRKQAEKLALGAELGDLTLALRGVGDDQLIEEKWPTTTDARMTGIREEIFDEYEKMKQETGTGVKRSVVKVYNGAQMQEVPVR